MSVATGATFKRMQVGTKDLKNRLSHYLEIVRAGEPIQVTARGKVVAEIRAVTAAASDDGACLDEMERMGLATRGRGGARDVSPVTMRGKRTLSEMINEDRE